MKDKTVQARINTAQLERLQKALGLDESKTIRACMNCTENVLQNFFGGEISEIFKRKSTDEKVPKYNRLGYID